jgi:hypothetical protein
MATHRKDTNPGHARSGDAPTKSVPAISDIGENSASGIIEAPQKPKRGKLDPHDFADGGGSGGAEAFSRKKTKK